jgi:hypothetical protein
MAATLVRHASASSVVSEEKIIQDMLYRIRQINYIPEDMALLDFNVDGCILGKVCPT